ncbi:dienelactone hydrolase family protein [Candidatus Saccharibacteria bacterium]|nr:dienelactone hydrolase family protein [Candidatus Saccharibacteria bacterium]
MDIEAHALITIPYDNTGIPAYLAAKPGQAVRPGLILIHEVWGLNNHIKDVTDRLCKEGYEVIAPDLIAGTDAVKVVKQDLAKAMFDPQEGARRQVELRAMMTPFGSSYFAEQTIAKLQACFEYLANKPNITKIGVMGFCFGGTYSFNLAINQSKLSATVAFYGHADHSDEEIKRINCPILAFYGELDTNLTDKLPQLEAQMKKAGKNFESKVYPGARHAFFNNTNPLTYNAAAASDSWQLAMRFLEENLK